MEDTAPASREAAPKKKTKRFLIQPMMVHVCYGLIPCLLASIYLFGLRALILALWVALLAFLTEGAFTFRQGKPVTSAVLVTSLIFTLSLPPTTPFWIASVGIVFAVVFGKMVFGGFGFNPFNPAMAGRCFIYIAFPISMTHIWAEPFSGGYGGFFQWAPPVDALTEATPLKLYTLGETVPWERLFLGNISGSLGETAAWLILLGGVYIIVKKSAPWRLAVSCLLGGFGTATLLWFLGGFSVPDPIASLLSASFLFGTFFVVTEPVSGPKTFPAQWIYGFMVGGLAMLLRKYSSFAEGFMFSILFMNIFASIMDMGIKEWKGKARTE